jgi:hypothetical protein
MTINKKFSITGFLIGIISLCAAASLPQPSSPPKLVNLKVFPKSIPYRVLDHQMDVWADALGVRCNFCHARDAQTGKMDFASDAKPEKTAARHMYVMMGKINGKFFEAQKDSLGMVVTTGVNCNTCHRGVSHPDIKAAAAANDNPGYGGPGPVGPDKVN